jgi:hypothetical protein
LTLFSQLPAHISEGIEEGHSGRGGFGICVAWEKGIHLTTGGHCGLDAGG